MRWFLGAAVITALLLTPHTAAAADPPLPAIAQYVEAIPTSEGAIRVGENAPSAPSPRPALSSSAESRLDHSAGTDEAALRAIVIQPTLGAPTKTLPRGSDKPLSPKDVGDGEPIPTAVLRAVTGVDGGGEARLIVLALGLLLVTPLLLVGGRRPSPRPGQREVR